MSASCNISGIPECSCEEGSSEAGKQTRSAAERSAVYVAGCNQWAFVYNGTAGMVEQCPQSDHKLCEVWKNHCRLCVRWGPQFFAGGRIVSWAAYLPVSTEFWGSAEFYRIWHRLVITLFSSLNPNLRAKHSDRTANFLKSTDYFSNE